MFKFKKNFYFSLLIFCLFFVSTALASNLNLKYVKLSNSPAPVLCSDEDESEDASEVYDESESDDENQYETDDTYSPDDAMDESDMGETE